jgi:hypothetical protein
MSRAFQVRSAKRDEQADRERLGSISKVIESAVVSVRNEKEALRARVDAARDLASFSVGTEYDEYLTRDSKDTARIKEYEREMLAGEQRIEELQRQLGGLEALQEVFLKFFSALK